MRPDQRDAAVELVATNASGETAESAGATAFYAGDISIGVGANADKAGLASGYRWVDVTSLDRKGGLRSIEADIFRAGHGDAPPMYAGYRR